MIALLQLGHQLEIACIHVHVNNVRKASFRCGSMMIRFLYKISKDSQGPNFVFNQNTVGKKVCHQQHTNIFKLGSLF
jgi:hypothetical protein